LTPDQALIFVTHDENEKPEGVTHVLRLANGRPVG
jgi:ABC-type molybdenum transport system ATPase subunit/photorepair protein PhrA